MKCSYCDEEAYSGGTQTQYCFEHWRDFAEQLSALEYNGYHWTKALEQVQKNWNKIRGGSHEQLGTTQQ